MNPTFFIGILDFEITQNTNYLSRHRITDIETGENLISDIEFTFIELPKVNKKENELTTIIDQWVYFLKNAENLQVMPANVSDEGLKNAYEDADKHNWTKAELEAYDYNWMRQQDERGVFSLAMKRAVRQAVEDNTKKIAKDIATNLLKLGIVVDDIAKSTGLTVEEVRELHEGL